MVPWDPETGFCQAGKAGENFLQPFKEMDRFYPKKRQFWFLFAIYALIQKIV